MARVNWEQVIKAAEVVAALPEDVEPLNFYSYTTPGGVIVAADMYPSLDHPRAVDYFFFESLHNYGFWFGDERGYVKPLVGTLDGKQRKGSDMLSRVIMRRLIEDPDWFRPEQLAAASDEDLRGRLFADDNGTIPFPDLDDRIRRTRAYGEWFAKFALTPRDLVDAANMNKASLNKLLEIMGKVRGFDADPLEKRQLLLAMALSNRPEGFLTVNDPERWRPVLDYHLMRTALRTGIIELDDLEREDNRARRWITAETEWDIRKACYDALFEVQVKSGRSHALNDFAFWKARGYCPEMEQPQCDRCRFNGFCAKRMDLFQPVYRTTSY